MSAGLGVGRHRSARAVVAATAVGVVTLLAFSGCTGTVDPTEGLGGVETPLTSGVAESLDALLAETVALAGASGGLATVSAPWAGEWSGAVGTVGFDEGAEPVSTDTPFRMGRLTGEITCLVLLKLAETGQLALDDEVSEYVDDIPGLDGITLEQLCRDTAGLADYMSTLRTHFLRNPERVWPEGELIASSLASDRVGEPGQTWSPSRTNLLLAALAAERATHRSWEELASQYVFGPLGLAHTSLPSPTAAAPSGALGAYAALPGGDGAPDCAARVDVSDQSSSIGGGAAGAVSTLADAARLNEAFATGALIGDHLERQQWTTTSIAADAPAWQTQGIGGMQYGTMRGVVSEAPGMLTASLTDPKSGLTVVVVLNNSTSGAEFVREAAFAFASLGSKTAPVADEDRPLIELPWSADQATEQMKALAKCPIESGPAEEAPAEEAPAEEAPAEEAPAEEAPAEG
ncbi:beta-lactamase family protein [Agromyces intestinalis]|uniref:Beta-lactamase family protein n=1 Tax=Agromyces intestinalis TaxID=2592652 RepID=A0A5C1YGQ0_9MICO|nr:serine hydrolase domain-containing protein [Agromyces intestinalis]QEO14590.1 beta-lactamase family protein [Agromyces intestinalis]